MKRTKAFWWFTLVCGAVAMVAPFWVMMSLSLMTLEEATQFPPAVFPESVQWQNYMKVFQQIPLGRYFFNSLLVAVVTTVGQLAVVSLAAYGFSRLKFPGKNMVFMALLFTMMIPPQVNIVPLFFVMKSFHWVDTYWALIVPGLFSAFGVFLLRQWFNGLPAELEDAARIDGCHPLDIFWRIALPLATPALVALGLFIFIGSWNGFMWPLIVTHSEGLRTLPVGIAELKGSYRDVTDWTMLMASSTVSVLPIVALFLVGQRYFMEGLLQGSLKE